MKDTLNPSSEGIKMCIQNVCGKAILMPLIPILVGGRVKSGNFRHRVNSDIHMQTVEILMRRPSHQDFHCLLS